MTEKRKHPRYLCKIKASLEYYPGNPDEVDTSISIPVIIKGYILDISAGGIFIITQETVGVNSPARVLFSTSINKQSLMGRIVRTGSLHENPSEIARKYSEFSVKGDNYIAVEFDEIFEYLDDIEI